MLNVFFDRKIADDERRKLLYQGDLFVYSPTETTKAFVEFAGQLAREAFKGLEPQEAQHEMEVEEFAHVLKELKPKFIHHPESKAFLQALLRERGCDPEKTYFDVPRMRTSTSDGYLTSGIAYAFHPHRDTWYSAPMCQLNWWLPIFPVESGNVMAFHPRYFSEPVQNGSRDYDYQEWTGKSRKEAAKHIKKDTRKQPKPEQEVELNPQVRVVTEPGGLMIFSAAHLHSSVPNQTGKTRFSIDFRTVNLSDLENDRGAANQDSACTGTPMNDYLRVTDLAHVPAEVQERYMAGHPQRPVLA
jgi:hypothetical protein